MTEDRQGELDEDDVPLATREARCPHCASGDVVQTGDATQVGIGNPWKEGRTCRTCGRYFHRLRSVEGR